MKNVLLLSLILLLISFSCIAQELSYADFGKQLHKKDTSINSEKFTNEGLSAAKTVHERRDSRVTFKNIVTTQLYDTISIGLQFHENDTTRTFGIFTSDIDNSIEKMISFWGEPTILTAGEIVWENVNIPGLHKKTRIEIYDGWLSAPYRTVTIKRFSSEDQKTEILSGLKEFQRRHTVITFKNKQGENIVNSKEFEVLVHSYLSTIL